MNLLSHFRIPILIVCALASTQGCRSASREGVVILVSGDTQGWITPCGCASNQSGGLARRAALAERLARANDLLLLDAGGSGIGTGAYQRIKLTSLLSGMQRMGLAAHNIGQAESQFTPAELREIATAAGTTWLSANLTATDGLPVGRDCLLLEKAGLSIAITGIVAPQLVAHTQWLAKEPVQAVLQAFEGQTADVRIVLAYVDEAGLRELAESLPEVDYIIGGPTGQAMSPSRVGPVTIMSATNKGKFLAQVALKAKRPGFDEVSAEIVEVISDLSEDREQLENLQDYYARLEQRDFTAAEAGLVDFAALQDASYAIAGSQACTTCHPADQAVWHASKHAHAWEVLVVKGAEFDPHCQQCHTTGYGIAGGFQNVAQSRGLVHVGCENCHGPSQAHARDPRKRTGFLAKEQCVRCHDHENSPEFLFDPYWTKIFHSGNKAGSDGEGIPENSLRESQGESS